MNTDPRDKLAYDRITLAHGLLNKLGITTPELTEPVIKAPAPEEVIESVSITPEPEIVAVPEVKAAAELPKAVEPIVPPAPAPVGPPAPVFVPPIITPKPAVLEPAAELPEPAAANTEEGMQTPVNFASLMAADPAPETETTTPSAISALTDEQRLTLMYDRDEAAKEARSILLSRAHGYLEEAKAKGYERFECHIDFTKPSLPIQLTFSREANVRGKKEIDKLTYTIDKYSEPYTKRGLPLTLGEAVAYMSIVQRFILSDEKISSATKAALVRNGSAQDLDRYLPFPIENWNIVNASGSYSLTLKGPNPSAKVRETTDISIPLGLTVRQPKDKGELAERDERALYILEMLEDIQNIPTAANTKPFIKKRHIMEAYKNWMDRENRGWGITDRMNLPQLGGEAPKDGEVRFDKNNLICVSPSGKQKITMAPVSLHMDWGASNPGWRASIRFHLGDKNEAIVGEKIRTRDLNLHTNNTKLAVARTWESLLGISSPRTGNTEAPGLLQQLQNLTKATQQEWQIEDKDKPTEKIIVCRMPEHELKECVSRYNASVHATYPLEGVSPERRATNKAQLENKLVHNINWPKPENGVVTVEFQHMLDDMIRYEKDLGVEQVVSSIPDKQGNLYLSIQATRSNTGDRRGTVKPKSEQVYDERSNTRDPIAFTLPIPAQYAEKIPYFVEAVRKDIHTFAERTASSVEHGENDKDIRKKPVEYRTAQVRNGLKQAIERLYAHEDEHFFRGNPLPKEWSSPEKQAEYATAMQVAAEEKPVVRGGFIDLVNRRNLSPGNHSLA